MAFSRTKVNHFSAGTAEYVVMHAKWRKSRGRKPSATFSQHKNPTKALKWAGSYAYFPISGEYLEGKVPEYYVCGECGATGVKLWREYQTSLCQTTLLCLTCACEEQGEARTPTEDGCSLYTGTISHFYRTKEMLPNQGIGYDPKEGPPPEAIETYVIQERSDQIDWRVPAVPTEESKNFWGYTSVPLAGVKWWCNLPFACQ